MGGFAAGDPIEFLSQKSDSDGLRRVGVRRTVCGWVGGGGYCRLPGGVRSTLGMRE